MARTRIPLVVLGTDGNPVQGASVTIQRRSSGTNATVYANSSTTATSANPGTTDALGQISGWLERGSYQAQITKSGMTPRTEYFESVPGGDGDIDTPWYGPGSIKMDDLDISLRYPREGYKEGIATGTSGKATYNTSTTATFASGAAWVQSASNGLQRAAFPQTTLTFPATAAGNYRIDSVIVLDNGDGAGTIQRLAGTEAAVGSNNGSYYLNLNQGGAAIPVGRYRIYRVYVTSDGIGSDVGSQDFWRDDRVGAFYGVYPPKTYYVGFGDGPAFAANWTHFVAGTDYANFRKNDEGLVVLGGTAKNTASTPASSTIFTLPVGFRPPMIRIFAVILASAATRLDVHPDGTVRAANAIGTANQNLSLDGVQFYNY